jgi:hypothetical protein
MAVPVPSWLGDSKTRLRCQHARRRILCAYIPSPDSPMRPVSPDIVHGGERPLNSRHDTLGKAMLKFYRHAAAASMLGSGKRRPFLHRYSRDTTDLQTPRQEFQQFPPGGISTGTIWGRDGNLPCLRWEGNPAARPLTLTLLGPSACRAAFRQVPPSGVKWAIPGNNRTQ